MARSQETFNKKQREKKRMEKKKLKKEKRENRKNDEKSGVEIDWSSAPENKTLSSNELEFRKKQKENNSNKNQ